MFPASERATADQRTERYDTYTNLLLAWAVT